MFPAGETERSIFEEITNRRADDVFGTLHEDAGTVGFGGNISGTLMPREKKRKKIDQTGVFIYVPEAEERDDPIAQPWHQAKNPLDALADHLLNRKERFGGGVMSIGAAGEDDSAIPPIPQQKPDQELKIEISSPPIPERKPVVKHDTEIPKSRGNENIEKSLIDMIGNIESSDNYNVIAGGKEHPLTNMTVQEIREFQKNLEIDGAASTALGRYQIKDDTLDYLVKRMKLKGDEVFDEELQDAMATELLKRRGLERFKNGEMSTERYILNLSKEWAALPESSSNQSYHKGVGNNKALIDYETMKNSQPTIMNLSYHEARQILIRNGWTPVLGNTSEENIGIPAIAFRNQGYIEVDDCTSTGIGYCTFYFQNEKGEYLRIGTEGEDNGPNARIQARVIYAAIQAQK